MDHTCEYVSTSDSTVYSHELVELIFIQPYCRIGHLIDAGIAQRRTATRYLKFLCDIGVLLELKIGREKMFIHTKFLRLLMDDDNKFNRYD